MNNLSILFVDVDYIKQMSTLMENVDDKFIVSHIIQAQDIHIQHIIGSALYEDMIKDFNTTSYTFNTIKYQVLNEYYIQPCLLYYTLYESVDDLYAKWTNKSILVQSSENSTPVSEKFIAKRKEDFLNKAEYYAKRLTNYLIRNKNIYTKYLEHSSDIDTIEPETKSHYFKNGWYLK